MKTKITKATTYQIDATHSEIAFSIKHLMITSIRGVFTQFEGKVVAGSPDFTDADIRVEIATNSLQTQHLQRDAHLKGDDFFDVAKFPSIIFQSATFIQISPTHYLLNGMLTIRDIQEPVQLKVFYRGKSIDMQGDVKYGFELEGSLSRKDFGLFWNQQTSSGNWLIADEVQLHLNIQLWNI
ncbi:MAG: YceI family protein [Sediminibacterium sp.]|nr:YceI family protein [Sediminibacterium sp.]